MKKKIPINGCRTTKIYCRTGCPPGRRTKPENRVYFNNQAEAGAKGYRACKVCKPDDPIEEVFILSRYESPLGPYILASSRYGTVGVKNEERAPFFMDRWQKEGISLSYDNTHHIEIEKQLSAYFKGELRDFTFPLDIRGTPFQRRVWDILKMIPWGQTRSYGWVAAELGRSGSARAVGRAVGTNPLSIVIPCHRVIGTDGSLTGYGGGLARKEFLLRHEDSDNKIHGVGNGDGPADCASPKQTVKDDKAKQTAARPHKSPSCRQRGGWRPQ